VVDISLPPASSANCACAASEGTYSVLPVVIRFGT